MYINKSLSFLEQTVIALADKNRDYIPFRQTKLTHYLKDSIGGMCNTVLIANIWGEAEQIEETVRQTDKKNIILDSFNVRSINGKMTNSNYVRMIRGTCN